MVRDLSDPWAEIRALKERVRILETATPLQDASVTRGRLRVASADGFVAEAVAGGAPAVRVTGLQVVDGTLRITGTLEGGGTWSWTGTLTQTGTTNLNGPWNLNGAGTIAGDVNQTGNTTQQGNVTLTGGGKVTAGNVRVEPNKFVVGGADGDTTFTNSQIQFANGGIVATDSSGGISMRVGSARVRVADGVVQMTIGTRSIVINSTGISGTFPTVPLASAGAGAFVGAIIGNASNQMFRVVA